MGDGDQGCYQAKESYLCMGPRVPSYDTVDGDGLST